MNLNKINTRNHSQPVIGQWFDRKTHHPDQFLNETRRLYSGVAYAFLSMNFLEFQ